MIMMNFLKRTCAKMNPIYSKSEQYAIVSILIMIMEADGVIDPNEVKFLNDVLSSFHISESELEMINSYDFNRCREILSGMATGALIKAKLFFTEMAKCDGYADPRELEIIENINRRIIIEDTDE